MAVFRVEVSGPSLPPTIDGVTWEGTRGSEGGSDRHYFMVEHDSCAGAQARVVDAVGSSEFSVLAVTEVIPPLYWPGLDGERDVDWDAIITRCGLTPLQGELLACLLDAGEPTWILARELKTANHDPIRSALSELRKRGIVIRTRQGATDPDGAAGQIEDWWAISDHGWATIGIIKRPWYQ